MRLIFLMMFLPLQIHLLDPLPLRPPPLRPKPKLLTNKPSLLA
jgi:hypothetical protein